MGMLLFGVILCVEIGFVIWAFVAKRAHMAEKEVVRIGCFLLAVVLLASGVLQGTARYGMLITVLGIQIVLGGIHLYRNRKKEEQPLKSGRVVAVMIENILLYGFALIPAFLFPQYTEPEVTGNHEVATKEYTWVDTSRVETYTDTGENRELTVKFWYPKDEGAYPLIIFSHGAMGVIDSNTSTCMELASNGYVVASIGHTYQAMYVKNTDGKVFVASQDFINQVYEGNGTDDPEMEKIIYENSQKWMEIRTADENFVLDTILQETETGAEEPFIRIDSEKIGLFGHSLGGATSVAVGRQRQDIDAVIDLEGTMLGEYVGFENGTEVFDDEPYPVPLLDVNSAEVDAEAKKMTGNGYVNFYVGAYAKDYHYEIIEGAGHLNFTDLPLVSPFLAKQLGTAEHAGMGDVDAKACIEQINSMVLDFFDDYLKE